MKMKPQAGGCQVCGKAAPHICDLCFKDMCLQHTYTVSLADGKSFKYCQTCNEDTQPREKVS